MEKPKATAAQSAKQTEPVVEFIDTISNEEVKTREADGNQKNKNEEEEMEDEESNVDDQPTMLTESLRLDKLSESQLLEKPPQTTNTVNNANSQQVSNSAESTPEAKKEIVPPPNPPSQRKYLHEGMKFRLPHSYYM
jgi:hypothetical protein